VVIAWPELAGDELSYELIIWTFSISNEYITIKHSLNDLYDLKMTMKHEYRVNVLSVPKQSSCSVYVDFMYCLETGIKMNINIT